MIQFLPKIIPNLFISLDCGNRLAMNAAGYAIDCIRELVGNSEFDSRCTPEQFEMMKNSTYVHSVQVNDDTMPSSNFVNPEEERKRMLSYFD